MIPAQAHCSPSLTVQFYQHRRGQVALFCCLAICTTCSEWQVMAIRWRMPTCCTCFGMSLPSLHAGLCAFAYPAWNFDAFHYIMLSFNHIQDTESSADIQFTCQPDIFQHLMHHIVDSIDIKGRIGHLPLSLGMPVACAHITKHAAINTVL